MVDGGDGCGGAITIGSYPISPTTIDYNQQPTAATVVTTIVCMRKRVKRVKKSKVNLLIQFSL